MANKILIIGPSGSGKSYAGRNLDPKSTFIINCDEKGLPFQGWKKNYKQLIDESGKTDITKSNLYSTTSPIKVTELLKYISENRKDVKVVIIDTITLLMVSQFMGSAKIKGYDKFVDMALEIYTMIKTVDSLRDDLTVIFTSHIEKDFEGNTEVMIPGGKLLKEKAKLEGMFTIVLETYVDYKDGKGEYYFITQNNGRSIAKSPFGLFKDYRIPNDYKEILECINKYEN